MIIQVSIIRKQICHIRRIWIRRVAVIVSTYFHIIHLIIFIHKKANSKTKIKKQKSLSPIGLFTIPHCIVEYVKPASLNFQKIQVANNK